MPTWTGNGSTNNWSEAANWDTGVPAAGTTAVFNGSGANGNKNVTITSGATCVSLDCTGYSGTMTFSNTLTVSTSVTFSSGMTLAGTSGISKTGNGGTLTFNGKSLPGSLTLPSGGGFATNVGDNLTILGSLNGNIGLQNLNSTGAVRTITVGTNLAAGNAGINCNNIAFVLNGTGTLSGILGGSSGTRSIEINTLGTITHSATLTLTNFTFTYTSGTFTSSAGLSLSGPNTFNNVAGISFAGLSFGAVAGQALTLGSNMNISGNLTNSTVSAAINGVGFKICVTGNIVPTQSITGTADIEMLGSSAASIATGTIQNNLIINKTGGATVSLIGNLTWGTTSRTLTLTSNFDGATYTLTLPAASVTIHNPSLSTLFNITIPSGGTLNITGGRLNSSGTLSLQGSATFGGTHGFRVSGFSSLVAGSTITFQDINTAPLTSYKVYGALAIVGTSASRIVVRSANSATFTGIANGTSLTYSSGTIPTIGMTVSHASGAIPTGFLNLLPNRPVILSGTSPNFTLDLNVSPSTGSISLGAGFKAILELENGATQNVAYTTTNDIDSSPGQTIQSYGSTSDTNIFRTLNWAPLLAPTPTTVGSISIR